MPRTLDSCETTASFSNPLARYVAARSEFEESDNQVAHVNEPDLNPRFKFFDTLQNESRGPAQNSQIERNLDLMHHRKESVKSSNLNPNLVWATRGQTLNTVQTLNTMNTEAPGKPEEPCANLRWESLQLNFNTDSSLSKGSEKSSLTTVYKKAQSGDPQDKISYVNIKPDSMTNAKPDSVDQDMFTL